MADPGGQDRYYQATIAADYTQFDAGQYSFFGDLNDADLEGALEDGLEAPPDELDQVAELGEAGEELEAQFEADNADADLSLTGLFRQGVGLGAERGTLNVQGGGCSAAAQPVLSQRQQLQQAEAEEDAKELEALISDSITVATRQQQQDGEVSTPRLVGTQAKDAVECMSALATLGSLGAQRVASGQAPQGAPLPGGLLSPSALQAQQPHAPASPLQGLFAKAETPSTSTVRGPIMADQLEARMLRDVQERQVDQQAPGVPGHQAHVLAAPASAQMLHPGVGSPLVGQHPGIALHAANGTPQGMVSQGMARPGGAVAGPAPGFAGSAPVLPGMHSPYGLQGPPQHSPFPGMHLAVPPGAHGGAPPHLPPSLYGPRGPHQPPAGMHSGPGMMPLGGPLLLQQHPGPHAHPSMVPFVVGPNVYHAGLLHPAPPGAHMPMHMQGLPPVGMPMHGAGPEARASPPLPLPQTMHGTQSHREQLLPQPGGRTGAAGLAHGAVMRPARAGLPSAGWQQQQQQHSPQPLQQQHIRPRPAPHQQLQGHHHHQYHHYQYHHYHQQQQQQQRPCGRLMDADDVEYVMRSMLAAVAGSAPYREDFYFQAFVYKHLGGRNRDSFAPDTLRDAGAELARLDPSAHVRFVDIQGLGKIVLSNVRTPKVLMDLSAVDTLLPAAHTAAAAGGDYGKDAVAGASGASGSSSVLSSAPGERRTAAHRPLDQEPLLAARIMVEDCLALLMDVEDIDRRLATVMPPAQHPEAAALHSRRALLLGAVVASFRLLGPERAAQQQQQQGVGDGVLLRIAALPKGRNLLARVMLAAAATPAPLKQLPAAATAAAAAAPSIVGEQAGAEGSVVVLEPGQQQQEPPGAERLLYAVLRNSWYLFGPSVGMAAGVGAGGSTNAGAGGAGSDASHERVFAESTSRLGSGLKAALIKLKEPCQVVSALEAFVEGCAAHVTSVASPAASPMDTQVLPLAPTKVIPGMFASAVTPASFATASGVTHSTNKAQGGAEGSTAAAGASDTAGAGAGGQHLQPPAYVEWLGDALAALCNRAEQLGLRGGGGVSCVSGDGVGEEEEEEDDTNMGELGARWRSAYVSLHGLVSCHLAALRAIHSVADASSNMQALALVRALTCRPLVQAMLVHAQGAERQALRDSMMRFLA